MINMEDEINLKDFFAVILKRWYLVLFAIVFVLVIYWLPQQSRKVTYEAKAAMILNQNASDLPISLGGLSNAFGLKSSAGSNINFPIILSSRAVAELVLDKYDLQKRIKDWDKHEIKRQDLISAVKKMAKYGANAGLFEITVVTEDPALSADVANGFAAAGAEYWKKLNYTEARKKREYIEGQLPRIEADLRRAENALKKFAMIAPIDDSLQGIEIKRLGRELEIQNATYILLRKEYESAKLEESKELEPFSMIDPAEKPLKPIGRKLILNFVISLVFGALVGIVLVFCFEALSKQK